MRYHRAICGLLLAASASAWRNAKLLTSSPAFANHPFPTIQVECPELGPSGAHFDKEHTSEGAGLMPSLAWPSPTDDTVEYVLVSEDPDAPIPQSVVQGIYYRISRDKTGVQFPDFRINNGSWEPYMLRGGFKYGKNSNDSVYAPPTAILGKGPHRYFFELIALNDSIETDNISDLATYEEIATEIKGKVAGWGEWIGVFDYP
ncbi:phosphatidylethanolamine-binding protein [Aspergillus unguis]